MKQVYKFEVVKVDPFAAHAAGTVISVLGNSAADALRKFPDMFREVTGKIPVKLLDVNLQQGLILSESNSVIGAYSRHRHTVYIVDIYWGVEHSLMLPDSISDLPRIPTGHISLCRWDEETGENVDV